MSEQDVKLRYLKQRPKTDIESLRVELDRLEKLVGSLRYLDADKAKEIPSQFDQVNAMIKKLEKTGVDLKSVRTQWETIGTSFISEASSYLQAIGGRDDLIQLRKLKEPAPEDWWWFADKQLADRRRSQGIRAGLWIGIAALLFLGASLVYKKFLAPDPATQTSLKHRFAAENFADQSNYQAAYEEVKLAIEAKPGQADLYLLKGVLADLLGKQDESIRAFEQAEAASQDRVTFLINRATDYLHFGQLEKAISDAQAAVALNSQQASAYLILGQAYENKGEFPRALDYYRIADRVATDQNDAQVQVIARLSIGQLYKKMPALAPAEAETPYP